MKKKNLCLLSLLLCSSLSGCLFRGYDRDEKMEVYVIDKYNVAEYLDIDVYFSQYTSFESYYLYVNTKYEEGFSVELDDFIMTMEVYTNDFMGDTLKKETITITATYDDPLYISQEITLYSGVDNDYDDYLYSLTRFETIVDVEGLAVVSYYNY